jgi:hypothetical protein
MGGLDGDDGTAEKVLGVDVSGYVGECEEFGEVRIECSWPLLISLLVSYGRWIIAGILLASNGCCVLLDGGTRLREGFWQHHY